MKRSTQVTLVLMTVGGIGAAAYALAPDGCRQSDPKRDPQQSCHSTHSSGGHAVHFGSSSGSSSGSGMGSTATPSSAETTSRGGFGWFGRLFSGGG
jgi:hypothetical protein